MRLGKKESHTPIDYSTLLENTGGDESFIKEVMGIYKKDFSEKRLQLKKAIKEKNFNTIKELGHSLKGASANLYLPFLQKASFQMEIAGKEKDIDKAGEALNLLEQEFQILKNHL